MRDATLALLGADGVSDLLGGPARWAAEVVHSFGYPGVFVLMVLSNVPLPLPSEAILPLAGFLAGQGRFDLPLLLVVAATGSLAGSLALYYAGRVLGEERLRRLVRRYGRFVLVGEGGLDRARGWFERHGWEAIVVARFVPGPGGLTSAAAGIERMPLPKFALYSGLSSVAWSGAFVGLGWALGDRWREAERYAHLFEYALLAVVAGGVLWFVWRRWGAHGG